MTIPALLAFDVLFECLRNRDWTTAKALIPAAVEETVMYRRCRIPVHDDDPRAAEPVGWRTAQEWCDLAPVVEWCELPEEERAATQRRLASLNRLPAVVLQTLPALRQQLMYAPHRPPQLVERLIEAVAAWKADPRRGHEVDSDLCAAYQALEDADIFRGQPELPPIPREEPEDDIPPPMAEPDELERTRRWAAQCGLANIRRICEELASAREQLKATPSRGDPTPDATPLTESNLAPDIERLNAAGWKLQYNGYWSLPGNSVGTHSTQAALRELDRAELNGWPAGKLDTPGGKLDTPGPRRSDR